MECIWNENDETISQLVFKKWRFTFSWRVWKFKNNSLKNYWLCPSHCLSTPGLSYNAILKMTKIGLEPITDPDMYIFFEKGTRGRISCISNRYTKANNKYLKNCNLKQESKHIVYIFRCE